MYLWPCRAENDKIYEKMYCNITHCALLIIVNNEVNLKILGSTSVTLIQGGTVMAVVTVSRLLGSGGDEVAAKVAENLGYGLVDTGLILEVAKRAGVSVEKVRSIDEKYQSWIVEWLKNLITPRIGKILSDEQHELNSGTFLDYVTTILSGLAEERKVVIVGRAGQFILKDVEHAFHVRIVADEPLRMKGVEDRYNISGQEARDMIKKSDSMRNNYIEQHFHADWDDNRAYHMVLNTSKLSIDEAVILLTGAVQKFSSSHEFVPGKKDRRCDGRRSGEETRKRVRRSGDPIWTMRDTQRAIIEGRPTRLLSKPDRREEERRKDQRR
jgi:cytidylate kinase